MASSLLCDLTLFSVSCSSLALVLYPGTRIDTMLLALAAGLGISRFYSFLFELFSTSVLFFGSSVLMFSRAFASFFLLTELFSNKSGSYSLLSNLRLLTSSSDRSESRGKSGRPKSSM